MQKQGMESLVDELVVYIFIYLDPKALMRARQLSRRYNSITKDVYLWKYLNVNKHLPQLLKCNKPEDRSWNGWLDVTTLNLLEREKLSVMPSLKKEYTLGNGIILNLMVMDFMIRKDRHMSESGVMVNITVGEKREAEVVRTL